MPVLGGWGMDEAKLQPPSFPMKEENEPPLASLLFRNVTVSPLGVERHLCG